MLNAGRRLPLPKDELAEIMWGRLVACRRL